MRTKFGVVQMVGDEFWTVLDAGDGGPDSKLFYIVGKMRGENGQGFHSSHDTRCVTESVVTGGLGSDASVLDVRGRSGRKRRTV